MLTDGHRRWAPPVALSSAVQLNRMWFETDVRNVLPAVRVPTLIISRGGSGARGGRARRLFDPRCQADRTAGRFHVLRRRHRSDHRCHPRVRRSSSPLITSASMQSWSATVAVRSTRRETGSSPRSMGPHERSSAPLRSRSHPSSEARDPSRMSYRRGCSRERWHPGDQRAHRRAHRGARGALNLPAPRAHTCTLTSRVAS